MATLRETELKIFIDAVTHYFLHLTSEPAEIRAAYLAETDLPRFDYTGLITLSGQFRGCIYFSAPRILVRELLIRLQEPDTCEANLLDAVGEVANTISGNARQHFGDRLEISVPITILGNTQQIKSSTRTRPFAILLRWQRYEAAVVIDIEATA
ncbi:chemotaxis protein CheX [Janthinobacterium sp. 17J80-10]|uniref:chemotaxis protein CheX n=1 Tax=Janthinobacterium sp. 17J80-10 TaxID=2497863 RepID=UPI0013E8D972|nr:chemotaxis protein CheX [Janthinobacterium sp. 17J80-10]